MKKITLIVVSMMLIAFAAFAQHENPLFSRLQGINNNGIEFFNVDGIEITSQIKTIEFSKKNILKHFSKLKIKEKDLVQGDSVLGFRNFYVVKKYEEPKGVPNSVSYYFVENKKNQILAVTFASLMATNQALERELVPLIRDGAIPPRVFNSFGTDSINFAGRQIKIGRNCAWRGVNNMQCPSYGQMSWSVHATLLSAQQDIDSQVARIFNQKRGKTVLDTTVAVIFEGTEVSARKITYDFTGLTSLLLTIEGGKRLNIYFVVAPVRNNYVSCVMSFWDTDQINKSGLPPLLEKVMSLK